MDAGKRRAFDNKYDSAAGWWVGEVPMLDAALAYASQGFPVFPLVPRGKTPLTSNGVKDATRDEATIRSWWTRWPSANIGLATGSASGVWVLDIDNKHGGLASLDALQTQYGALHTLSVRTGGGGLHFYYKLPEGLEMRNKQGALPGIDIRGEGGYVVAPPSQHESGEFYRGEVDMPIAAAPQALLDILSPPTREARELPGRAAATGEKGVLAKSTLAFIAEGAAPGTWHAAFYKAAMDLKQNQYNQEEAYALLEKATGHLDSTDEAQLADVYANRIPRHPPRVIEGEGECSAAAEDNVVPASTLVDAMVSYLSDKSKVKGLPTMIEGLDGLLGGGKRLGELTAWCAEAKTGKNTLWHQLMYYWLEAGVPIGYASRELSPESEVLPNLLSLKLGVNAWTADTTPELVETYRKALAAWPLYFAKGYGVFELESLTSWVRSLRSRGVEYFWIDHLHYCLDDSEDFKLAAQFARSLKSLAKQENIHIDLIVQPTKIAEGQRLGLNAMRGGAAIGQAIDNLFILERLKGENMPAHHTKLSLDVARSKLCNPGSIYLAYDKHTTRFTEVELEPASPPPVEDEYEKPIRPKWEVGKYVMRETQ